LWHKKTRKIWKLVFFAILFVVVLMDNIFFLNLILNLSRVKGRPHGFTLVLEAVCANFTAIYAIFDRNYLPHPKKDVGI
jgi:F0F1-type ATP synthase membrane subunit a